MKMMSFANNSSPHDFTHPVNQVTNQTPSRLLLLISNIFFGIIKNNIRPIKNQAEVNKVAFYGVRAQFHLISIATFKLANHNELVMHATVSRYA